MGNGCMRNIDDQQVVHKMKGIHELPKKGKKSNTAKNKPPGKAKKYSDKKSSSSNGARNGHPQSVGDRPPLPEIPGKESSTKTILKARYDYQPRQADDLGFKKDDRLELISEDTESDWWEARHLQSGQHGFVPSNYVVIDDDRPEHQEWFFAFDRREADKQLTLPSNPNGTFLVRTSSDKKSYALSIRMVDPRKENETGIKHYRIRLKENGRGCYINPKRAFDSLTELIEHYKNSSDGLCSQLSNVCPKEPAAVPFKDIEVERSCIRMHDKLGEGMFGEVFGGKWNNQVEVAVKTLRPGSMSADAFLQEAKLMHKLRHPKLVLLMGVCTTEEPIYIITELMENGALLDYLRKKEKSTDCQVVVDMAAQIASGMSYLEEKNFIHRDVRAANMLVGKNNTVKVADFGLARVLEDDDEYTAHAETKFPIKWTAPEAAFDKSFSVKSDIWSFGILLYEMITYGRVPYPGMSGQEALRNVEKGHRMPKPIQFECPESLYEIMLKCWAKQPMDRPTFEFLYAFFDDYFISTEPNYGLG